MANVIKYNKIRSNANTVSNLSSDIKKQITKLNQLYSKVKSEWKGPAADEFLKHLNRLILELTTTRDAMTKVSSTITSTANKMQREEEEKERREAEKAKLAVDLPPFGSTGGGSR